MVHSRLEAKNMAAKKKSAAGAKKKKISLDKETVKKLNDDELGKVAGGMQPDSYMSCNMRCTSAPPPACASKKGCK
jgi:hypothetical protein